MLVGYVDWIHYVAYFNQLCSLLAGWAQDGLCIRRPRFSLSQSDYVEQKSDSLVSSMCLLVCGNGLQTYDLIH